ncbi:hypothetical protein NEOLEDRAFT_1109676 [Neolentinus lepideus HHB14362 ss-1]|uniref:Uncharacterized protein n=1 Tax=Neolentinus lepideus HHB14362 ss-1 TaxID=1314782 RepID=A0A165UHH5_9AGAM|nr:hypothetical protein NEOLEDRAFT_1109676 [Neolentinus lepideus HHB14362 ss-1]
MSSPGVILPSTPRKVSTTPYSNSWRHQPQNSSPLASSPFSQMDSSPVPAAQKRRQSTQTPVLTSYMLETPTQSRIRSQHPRRTSLKSMHNTLSSGKKAPIDVPPESSLLRERFKARCFERARKAKQNAVKRKRYENEPSSDGFDLDAEMDCDDEEVPDELWRRIMVSAERKARHTYRFEYQWEVGSSIDPDMEDVSRLEQELRGQPQEEIAPPDLEEEELAAYAEEAALWEDLGELPDDLFDLSDFEEPSPAPASTEPMSHTRTTGQTFDSTDFDMDIVS